LDSVTCKPNKTKCHSNSFS